MAVPTVSKYKDLEIEIEKMYLITTTVPVIMGALGMIKKRTGKDIKILGSLSLYEIPKKWHLAELLICFVEYYEHD